MSDNRSPLSPRRWLQALIVLMWPLELLNMAFPSAPLTRLLAAGLAVFVAAAFVMGRWQTRALVLALAAVTAGFCAAFDSWHVIPRGFEKTLIFVAFMSTIVMLRATAEQRREIATARSLFTSLDHSRRRGGVLIGSHFLGAVLIVGIFAVLAPILDRDATENKRRDVALTAIRGMSFAVLWSPFFVGMAVASHYLPAVRLWQIMPMGLAFAAFGLLIAYFMSAAPAASQHWASRSPACGRSCRRPRSPPC